EVRGEGPWAQIGLVDPLAVADEVAAAALDHVAGPPDPPLDQVLAARRGAAEALGDGPPDPGERAARRGVVGAGWAQEHDHLAVGRVAEAVGARGYHHPAG